MTDRDLDAVEPGEGIGEHVGEFILGDVVGILCIAMGVLGESCQGRQMIIGHHGGDLVKCTVEQIL